MVKIIHYLMRILNELEVLLKFDSFICTNIQIWVQAQLIELRAKFELEFELGDDLIIFLINNTLF